MTATGSIDPRHEVRKRLLEISVWAMTLILALVLERSSGAIVFIVDTPRHVDAMVWGAVFLMALVFGILLATTVGILVLHILYQAPYRYWYVVVDNVLVTVPLYVAVRFVAASIGFEETATRTPTALHLEESPFRIGVALIALSYVFLVVRDLMALPGIRERLPAYLLFAVGALHFLAFLLFLALAIAPDYLGYVLLIGAVGLLFFFAGMLAAPFIEKYPAAAANLGEEARASG
jgi:hypothetical protein